VVTMLYDDDCGVCRSCARWVARLDRRSRIRAIPIASGEGDLLLSPVPAATRGSAMHAVRRDGRVYSGGATVPVIVGLLPGGRPLAAVVAAFPGLTDRTYRAFASRRAAASRIFGLDVCGTDQVSLDHEPSEPLP